MIITPKSSLSVSAHRFTFHRSLLSGSAVFLAALVGQTMAEEPTVTRKVDSVAAPVRDHHLFVGVNLFVQDGGELEAIQSIDKNEAVVLQADGEQRRVSLEGGFRWKKAPKVAPFAVKLDQLSETPVFSVAANPVFARESQQANLLEYFTTRQNLADREFRYVDARISSADEMRSLDANVPSADEIRGEAMNNVAMASTDMQRFRTSVSADQIGVDGEEAQAYDGLVHEFLVSSPQVLRDAYAVVMVRLRDAEGEMQDFNYSRSLGVIDAEPRRVRLAQFHMPPGFELLESEIHIFSRGEELPTNYAEKQLSLTAEEARQFALESHLAQHRHGDTPAVVVWALAPEALRTSTDPTMFDHEVVVTLDERGRLEHIEANAQTILPATVRALMRELVYLPAVKEGVAVASSLEVNPSVFFQ